MSEQEPYWPNRFFSELIGLAEVEDSADRFVEMTRHAAEELTQAALEDPARSLATEHGKRAGFEARLASRWRRALDLFDLTVEQALEAGRWINTGWRPRAAEAEDQTFEALIRLHGRAVMTAKEVQVLLRSGYASGALARWRTIHEIWVVASLLSEQDQELSRRYLVHEAIESMKAQKEYEDTWEALGYAPPDPANAAKRDELRASLKEEFGAAFLNDYGWAADLFNGNAPKLGKLTGLAKLDHWRGFYRMASHGIHANPKGISWNIQSIGPSDVIWAGPSNAGLVDPAQCTLIALAGITVNLVTYTIQKFMTDGELSDQALALVREQMVLLLQARAIEAFDATHKEQEGQEVDISQLVTQASELLTNRPYLTAEELAEALQADDEELTEALEAGVQRGLLSARRQYSVRDQEREE